MENFTNQTETSKGFIGDRFSQSGTAVLILLSALYIILGMFGNGLVIASVITEKTLRTRYNVFIITLAVADMAVLGYILPFFLLEFIWNRYPAGKPTSFCKINGLIMSYCHTFSKYSIVFVAVNSYVKICKPIQYNVWLSRRNTVISVIILMLIPLPLNADHLLGFGALRYNPNFRHCFLLRREKSTHFSVRALLTIAVPTVVVTLLYVFIFLKVWSSRRRVRNTSRNLPSEDIGVTYTRQDVTIALSIFVKFGVLFLLEVPVRITLLLGNRNDTWPVGAYVAGFYCGHCNSVINSLIYGVMNRQFRTAYKKLLCVRERPIGTNNEGAS